MVAQREVKNPQGFGHAIQTAVFFFCEIVLFCAAKTRKIGLNVVFRAQWSERLDICG